MKGMPLRSNVKTTSRGAGGAGGAGGAAGGGGAMSQKQPWYWLSELSMLPSGMVMHLWVAIVERSSGVALGNRSGYVWK